MITSKIKTTGNPLNRNYIICVNCDATHVDIWSDCSCMITSKIKTTGNPLNRNYIICVNCDATHVDI